MKVCEIFTSIQGESSYAGLPCTFIRLSGCNLRCSYCDTQYAYDEGDDLSFDAILSRVRAADFRLIELTGGEPLLQDGETCDLIKNLLDEDYNVIIETNGTLSIKDIDDRATIIMDMKTPASGMSDQVNVMNLDYLKPSDEIKFVLCDRPDYEWAKKIIFEYRIADRCTILLSPAYGKLDPSALARWILKDRLDVRLNLQIHKYIFGPEARQL